MSLAHPRRTLRLAAPALAALSLACGRGGDGKQRDTAAVGTAGDTGGTMIISAAADVDILLPPLVSGVEGKRVSDMLFDHLAEIGDSLNTIGDGGFERRLSDRWEWAKDSMSIAFHLDPKARWHDGKPVVAEDVRMSYQINVDPVVGSVSASGLENIDSVAVRDSSTAVVWFKQRAPEQFFQVAYNLTILPSHLLGKIPHAELKSAEFGHNPVGTGRFRFVKWVPGSSLELAADTANYRGRAKLDRVIVTVSPDFTSAVTKLYAGEADFFENVRAENLPELAKNPDLVARPRPAFDYGVMSFNLLDGASSRPHPIFADRNVRRALTMAMDRQAMVRSAMDSLGQVGIGPATRSLGGNVGQHQIAYDTLGAARLLDSLGWKDGNGDGVREKGGRPLAFSLAVPTSSKTRSNFAVLIQEQLKRVGAKVTLDAMETNALMQRDKEGTFDAVMLAWSADPSPAGSLRQSWGAASVRAKGGSNYGSYVSAAFDAHVDSGARSFDPTAARRHFAAANDVIVEDAPAVWLYEPRPFYGAHKRIHVVGVRQDAWWAGIADWSIPAGERIKRDRTLVADAR